MKYYLKTEHKIIPDVLDRDNDFYFVIDKITTNDTLYNPWIEVSKEIFDQASKMLDPSSDAMNVPNAKISLEFVDGVPVACSMAIDRIHWSSEEEKEEIKARIIKLEALEASLQENNT